jgi:hypothetical protein
MNKNTINKLFKNFTIFGLLLFVRCSPLNKAKPVEDKGCNENVEFKKAYFENIQNVENLITKSQNQSFHKSLNFISKYSKVSFGSMANYARTYPYGSFEEDKKKLLEWYEDNKCKNIQFKDSL